MGREGAPPPAVRAVFDENQQIMDLIEELAEKQQNKPDAESVHRSYEETLLQRILDRIYRNIARYGNVFPPDGQSDEAYFYDVWRGLLNTIKAILKLPGTDFIGARMFDTTDDDDMLKADENLADLYELCTEADDVLLRALRKIWICSGQTESFDWVFTEHRIDRPISHLDAEIAVCLSLEGYKRRFSKRQQGRQYYYSEPDDKNNLKLYTGPEPRWYPEEGMGLDPNLIWLRMKGNASPITDAISYTIDFLGDGRDDILDWVCVFRRSWQFCLDAQQIAEGNLGNQRQELLNTILLRRRIPREIQSEIQSYLTDRDPFPYLKKLDIGAVYTPFPTVGERCLECEHLDENSAIKRACPQTGLYIWNLALRRFHSFHKNAFNQWSLCSHGSDCKGHHDCSDHSWAVLRDPDFTLFIEKEAARGNDEFISLDQVGLGPVQHIRLSKVEDEIRDKRLHRGSMIYNEAHRDLMMIGGLGGLVDSMLHGRVLLKAWSEGPEAGTAMTLRTAEWAFGRNLLVQRAAELAIIGLHSWPGRCEWCPGKELFDGGVARSSCFQETIRSKIEPRCEVENQCLHPTNSAAGYHRESEAPSCITSLPTNDQTTFLRDEEDLDKLTLNFCFLVENVNSSKTTEHPDAANMDDDLISFKLDRILRLNYRLTRLINNLAQKTGDITQEVKNLLTQLYDGLVRLYDAFGSNLNDGELQLALRQVPSCGEFVAARLLLFTGWTFTREHELSLKYKEECFVEETKPLPEFIADLDDALLEPLKKMWELSQSSERFDWIFMDFNITDDDEMTAALALSPQELEDLDGIRGMKYYYRDTSESKRYTLYTGPIPRWDCGEQDWDDFKWRPKGSDGPISGWLEYNYRDDDAPDVNFAHGFHIFHRSHQFCLDARQKSEAHIGRQQHQTFDEVARRLGIPPEMRNRILSYVEYRDPFPYLEKLDLAEAYVPFPKVGGALHPLRHHRRRIDRSTNLPSESHTRMEPSLATVPHIP
ncbi:hypothetical protein FACUT_5793 [Fusarium acutatum]|uniref:Uncharacterized protein n=1 Tax=Fusarium acutatum TaxID=78861 RepID=A0A8H4JUK8_9HYPO|nr:hypothetical protein FACUT_5793 [Fusarium acutatum]